MLKYCKKISVLALLGAVGVLGGQEPITLDSRGCLKIGTNFRFVLDIRTNNRNYNQAWHTKAWQFQQKDFNAKVGKFRYQGALNIPNCEGTKFEGALEKIRDNCYRYRVKLAPTKKIFTLRSALKGAKFLGQNFYVDDQKLQFPTEKKKTLVRRGQVQKFQMGAVDGVVTLEFSPKVHFMIHDYRPRPNEFNLMFNLESPADNAECQMIDLKITFTPYQSHPINLARIVNMGFADAQGNDGKGGWTDQGAENDLRKMPTGRKKWQNINFTVINPAQNSGKGCLALRRNNNGDFLAQAQINCPPNTTAPWLFLLHASAWGHSGNQTGSIVVNYADGSSQVLDVREGRDVGNWWGPTPLANAEVIWTTTNSSSLVGLYRSNFKLQNKAIKSLNFKAGDAATWLIVAATLGNYPPPAKKSAPYYILPGKNFQVFNYAKEVQPGSVMDFSWRLDAPAGKYGPVVVRNGRFEFAQRPGQAARFYGSNLVAHATFVNREWAERIADRFAHYGFNLLRIHHHDGGLGDDRCSWKMDAKDLDSLDYLIYALKKRGIYITTDLYVSRGTALGEIPEFPDKRLRLSTYKALFWISDAVYDNWKKFTANWLNHVNPYTKMKLKDDPALVSINIINEGNITTYWSAQDYTKKIYLARYDQWLKQHNLTRPPQEDANKILFHQFLVEIYRNRYQQMVKFLRELGLKCPVSDQNMQTHLEMMKMRQDYDYVDAHGYYCHPVFLKGGWRLPSTLSQCSILGVGYPVVTCGFSARIWGKPFVTTEFDYAKPNRFRAEGAPLMGAYGALQNWDMLVQFAYSHVKEKFPQDYRVKNYFDLTTDPVKMLSQYIGVALFDQKLGITPAQSRFAVLFDPATIFPSNRKFQAELSQLGQIAQLGTVIAPQQQAIKLPQGTQAVIDCRTGFPKHYQGQLPVVKVDKHDKILSQLIQKKLLKPQSYDARQRIFRSENGEIELNRSRETFRASAPGCEVLITPHKGLIKGKIMQVKNIQGRGVFAVIAADGKKLKDSKKLLILHLTDTQASQAKFASADMEQLDSWGKFPFLAAAGKAEITLQLFPGKYHLFAVDMAGKRLKELPVKNNPRGQVSFAVSVFNKFGSTMCYELIRQ